MKSLKEKKMDRDLEKKKKLLSLYGGEENTTSIPTELIYGQTEEYKEYTAEGSLLPKYDTTPITNRSKYQEDVFRNNHTSVWGSYYDKLTGQWGYKCCLQQTKSSFCIGIKIDGLKAPILPSLEINRESSSSSSSSEASSSSEEDRKEKTPKHKKRRSKSSSKKKDKKKHKKNHKKKDKHEEFIYREKKRKFED